MAENSTIEWTDHTFNPWIGCTQVSPGCANCYAAAQDKFRKWTPEGWGAGKPRRRTKTWGEPLKWNNKADMDATQAEAMGMDLRRPRVFCASLADWLDDEVPIEWLADLLKLIHDTPNLDWLLLTKRPENFEDRISDAGDVLGDHPDTMWPDTAANDLWWWVQNWLEGHAPRNVWIGTTVEDQARADERIPALLKIPARVRFLSCEPLLEGVDLRLEDLKSESLHWLICGGESGPGKRAMNPEWARALRDQCAAAGVPFFMKQMDKVQPIPADLMVRQFPQPKTLMP